MTEKGLAYSQDSAKTQNPDDVIVGSKVSTEKSTDLGRFCPLDDVINDEIFYWGGPNK